MSRLSEREQKPKSEFKIEALGGDKIYQWLQHKTNEAKIGNLSRGHTGESEDDFLKLGVEKINDEVIESIASGIFYNTQELKFEIKTSIHLNDQIEKPKGKKKLESSFAFSPFEMLKDLDGNSLNLQEIADILERKADDQNLELKLEDENCLKIKSSPQEEFVFLRIKSRNPFDPINLGYLFYMQASLNGKGAEEFKSLYQRYGNLLQKLISAAYESQSIPIPNLLFELKPPSNLDEKLENAKQILEANKRMLRAGGILDEDFSEMIQERIRLKERPRETFDDIGGSEKVKEELRSILIGLKNPEFFRKWGTEPARGVLLYGEPGTGKTLLAKALAHEADVDLYVVQVADIVNSLYGRSEKLIQGVFDDALRNRPCIVFFDEIDALASHREHSTEVTSRIVTTFLTNLDGLKERTEGMVVIGTTNRQNAIDPAMLRPGRFDTIIEVPLPDENSRKEIFRIHLNAARKTAGTEVFDELDLDQLVKETRSMSGADIKELIRRALAEKVKQEIAGYTPSFVRTKDVINVISGYERISTAKNKLGFV